VTTPATIAFVDCVLAAVLAGLVLTQLGQGMGGAVVGAAITFVVALVLFAVYSARKASAFWLERPRPSGD
jgi:predicted LPLAT superfamily acyltransferase